MTVLGILAWLCFCWKTALDCLEVALTKHLLSGNILKQVLHAVQDQAASLTRSSHSCHLKSLFSSAEIPLPVMKPSLAGVFSADHLSDTPQYDMVMVSALAGLPSLWF